MRICAICFNGKRYTQGFMNGTDYFPYLEVGGLRMTLPALSIEDNYLRIICNVKWKANV